MAGGRETVAPGFVVARGLVSDLEQEDIVSALVDDCMLSLDPTETHNQAFRAGALMMPTWARRVGEYIRAAPGLFPPQLVADAPFDQLIVNRYLPGEGIKMHVDLDKFEEPIAGISLLGGCVFDLAHRTSGAQARVYLQPGDVYAMWGPARFEWRHGIAEVHADRWEGRDVPRAMRVSVTLRRLRPNAESMVPVHDIVL